MARGRRALSGLIAEIYETLKEAESTSFWEKALVISVFNRKKDLREMKLLNAREGYGVERHFANIVKDQTLYTLPEDLGRLNRVLRVFPSENNEIPMERNELVSLPTSTQSAGKHRLPTYRVIKNQIVLDRPYDVAVVNGLKMEFEAFTERMTADSDELPNGWPLSTESLLVLDTVHSLLGIEEALDSENQFQNGLWLDRREYEGEWQKYIDTRTFSRTFATRFSQGG